MHQKEETIAAIATPLGEGGIGIVRVSGPKAEGILRAVFSPKKPLSRPVSHHLYLGEVKDPNSQAPLDHAMACLMKAPRSYTGEDVVELSCHGGPGVMRRVLDAVVRAGARHAAPGEFTKRAFLNGRLDLTQAEAVLDLVRSRTERSHAQALALLTGSLSEKIMEMKDALLQVLAGIEASIDFPEEDVGTPSSAEQMARVESIALEMGALLRTYEEGKVCREGALAAFVGRPNVGKSSLLNALLGEERAIVTEIPGTTRDYIEELVNIQGYPVRLLDTAGLWMGRDRAEEEGVRRAKEKFGHADILLLVLDGSEPLHTEDVVAIEETRGRKFVLILNKTDLPLALDLEKVRSLVPGKEPIIVSAKYGTGLDVLRGGIVSGVMEKWERREDGAEPFHGAVITRERHREDLRKALEAVKGTQDSMRKELSPELIAVDLQLALEALSEIVGETTTEDVLDRIFNEFCVGK